MSDDIKKKIDVVFIAGGKFHDIDFARLEILKLLAEDDRMKTRVFEDYSNLYLIEVNPKKAFLLYMEHTKMPKNSIKLVSLDNHLN